MDNSNEAATQSVPIESHQTPIESHQTPIESHQTSSFTPITTQEEFYVRIKDQIGKALASAVPEDYESAKAEAAKVAGLTERAEKAEAALAELQRAKEIADARDRVAAETGIPAAALRGDTEEELRSHAEAIRAAIPVYPQVREAGGLDAGTPVTKESVLAIKNPAERRAAILANLELFD